MHTWNVVEIAEDSTSSSNSNSTRRASSKNSEQQDPPQAEELPASPASDADLDASSFSPVRQQDLERLRYSAATGHEHIGGPELSSSPFSGSSADGSEDTGVQSIPRDDNDDDDDDNSSESDAGFDAESTSMSMDDVTARSAVTTASDDNSPSPSARLNETLHQAARESDTKVVEDNENGIGGDMSMEIADQEITGAFQPWIKKGQRQSFDWDDISALHDQENVDPAKQPIGKSHFSSPGDGDHDNGDLSMEQTNAVGQILTSHLGDGQGNVYQSEEKDSDDGKTMEFTGVVGGIKSPMSPVKSAADDDEMNDDEGMTMEFTNVVGGVLDKSTTPPGDPNYPVLPKGPEENPQASSPEANDQQDATEGMDMEFTGAVGGILPPTLGQVENQEEMATAVDGALPSGGTNVTGQSKSTEPDSYSGHLAPPVSPEKEQPGSAHSPVSFHVAAVASENGSPSLASVRSRRTRRSSRGAAGTPNSTSRHASPEHKLSPGPQLTPRAARSEARSETSPSKRTPLKEFVPHSVPRSAEKRSSGLGIDREGLGSPSVAAMLDKRRSIGDEAPQFVPRLQGVRFEDPLRIHDEVDREREEEERREDGHMMQERDATSSLREMISSLTPKKDKVRGRKSLHVGTAKGLLGKRPVELDMNDEDVDDTPKRLRAPDASPVKNVKLPAPSSNDGMLSRSMRSSLGKPFGLSPARLSPAKPTATPAHEPTKTPRDMASPLKRGMESLHLATPPAPVASPQQEEDAGIEEEEEANYEPIQLQEFLNMTNIHFMELTTTKRRHTTAPGSIRRASRRSVENETKSGTAALDDSVAAGFCTLPMLELYQHVSVYMSSTLFSSSSFFFFFFF